MNVRFLIYSASGQGHGPYGYIDTVWKKLAGDEVFVLIKSNVPHIQRQIENAKNMDKELLIIPEEFRTKDGEKTIVYVPARFSIGIPWYELEIV